MLSYNINTPTKLLGSVRKSFHIYFSRYKVDVIKCNTQISFHSFQLNGRCMMKYVCVALNLLAIWLWYSTTFSWNWQTPAITIGYDSETGGAWWNMFAWSWLYLDIAPLLISVDFFRFLFDMKDEEVKNVYYQINLNRCFKEG